MFFSADWPPPAFIRSRIVISTTCLSSSCSTADAHNSCSKRALERAGAKTRILRFALNSFEGDQIGRLRQPRRIDFPNISSGLNDMAERWGE